MNGVGLTHPVHEPIRALSILLPSIAAAAAAGLVAWALAERFRVNEVEQFMVGLYAGTNFSVARVTQNGAIAYASLGGLLGLGLGLVAALRIGAGSLPHAFIAGVPGAAIGAAVGAASCYAFLPIYFRDMESADLTLSVLIHLGIWAALGAAVGIAFGLGSGQRRLLAGSLVGGMTGAALGVLIFDLAGAFLPLAHTEKPLSEVAGTRLATNLVLGICATIGILVVAAQKPRATAKHS